MTETSYRPSTILLVEDSESDAFLTREAVRELGAFVDIHHVENGRQCLAFLRKEPPFQGMPTPDLVLLDLNMPVMNGRSVLATIADDRRLRATPVVVLTTSSDEDDVLDAYRLGCNAYVSKPLDFDRFGEVIRGIWRHWFALAVLPPKRSTA